MNINHVEYIIETLREVYIALYSDNSYIKRLNDDIISHIKNHYGDDSYDPKTNQFKILIGDKECVYQFPNVKIVLGETLEKPKILTSKSIHLLI